jgi:putative redox protein
VPDTPKETLLTLVDDLHFIGRTASGFEIDLDSRIAGEEPLAGPSPMEIQLLALGGCTGMDVISILRKMRQDVTGYDVRLTHERAVEHPRIFKAITMTHLIRGRDLEQAMVVRAISLTMARYCPVFAMLSPSVDIRERYEVTDEATAAAVATGEIRLDDAIAAVSG